MSATDRAINDPPMVSSWCVRARSHFITARVELSNGSRAWGGGGGRRWAVRPSAACRVAGRLHLKPRVPERRVEERRGARHLERAARVEYMVVAGQRALRHRIARGRDHAGAAHLDLQRPEEGQGVRRDEPGRRTSRGSNLRDGQRFSHTPALEKLEIGLRDVRRASSQPAEHTQQHHANLGPCLASAPQGLRRGDTPRSRTPRKQQTRT